MAAATALEQAYSQNKEFYCPHCGHFGKCKLEDVTMTSQLLQYLSLLRVVLKARYRLAHELSRYHPLPMFHLA